MMQFGLQRLRGSMRGGRALALVCLLLAAFVLQIAVTRSHFHLGVSIGLAKADPATGTPAKFPPGHDDAKCPLWQASGVCGSAIPASAADLFALTPPHARAAARARVDFFKRFAAAWRSRAPPSV